MANWFDPWIIDSGGESSETTPPVVTSVSPDTNDAPGNPGAFNRDYTIAKDTPIVVTVVDASSAVAFVSISVKFSDRNYTEEIYAGQGGAGWDALFVTGSAVTGSGAAGVGYTFSIRRNGGWPPGPNPDGTPLTASLRVRGIDAKGNVIL